MKANVVVFRFPIKQINPHMVELQIPRGPNGMDVINPDFQEAYGLDKSEVEKAEALVIRAVAIISPDVSEERLDKMLHGIAQWERDMASSNNVPVCEVAVPVKR
jgi:hypothetical protein